MRITKKKKKMEGLIDPDAFYSLEDSVDLLLKVPKAKFDETVEVSVKLGIDTKMADQQVRGTVRLPHGTGKTIRIIVIAEGEDVKEALEAGAMEAGAGELLQKIEKGWLDFDCLITKPSMMKLLAKLGKILGPRGLMPNPKSGTVTQDIPKAVKEMQAGRIEYRADKASDVHVCAGKASFDKKAIVENIRTLIMELLKVKPSSAKGPYFKSIAVSTTMGAGIRLDVNQFKI
ncbi:50S ribosomal protein L1 [PVC group bacterium]|nr:50S ribosomal protein L1 [PVC group bacterium]